MLLLLLLFFLIPFRLSFINLSKPHICNVQLDCFCWGALSSLYALCIATMFPKRFYHLPTKRYHWKPVFWLQQQLTKKNIHNKQTKIYTTNSKNQQRIFHPNSLICSQYHNVHHHNIALNSTLSVSISLSLSLVWFKSSKIPTGMCLAFFLIPIGGILLWIMNYVNKMKLKR